MPSTMRYTRNSALLSTTRPRKNSEKKKKETKQKEPGISKTHSKLICAKAFDVAIRSRNRPPENQSRTCDYTLAPPPIPLAHYLLHCFIGTWEKKNRGASIFIPTFQFFFLFFFANRGPQFATVEE